MGVEKDVVAQGGFVGQLTSGDVESSTLKESSSTAVVTLFLEVYAHLNGMGRERDQGVVDVQQAIL
ncbi:hypothetical protein RBB50_009569 [Rhinocladiella similis]